jgi:hypothetical protein
MNPHDSDLDPELEAFLRPAKIQRQVPAALRARALARARATVAAEDGVVPPLPAPEPSRPMRAARGRRLAWIAVAASVVLAAGAVGAAAALHVGRARAPEITAWQSAPAAPTAPIAPAGGAAPSAPLALDEEIAASVKPSRAPRAGAKADPFTAELDLVQRAHAAYTRHDFSVALTLVAEHARRFPRGHLAEQREALRVRSLVGAGRADEAQRAAAAFAARFPRSVLLPRVAGSAESPER